MSSIGLDKVQILTYANKLTSYFLLFYLYHQQRFYSVDFTEGHMVRETNAIMKSTDVYCLLRLQVYVNQKLRKQATFSSLQQYHRKYFSLNIGGSKYF